MERVEIISAWKWDFYFVTNDRLAWIFLLFFSKELNSITLTRRQQSRVLVCCRLSILTEHVFSLFDLLSASFCSLYWPQLHSNADSKSDNHTFLMCLSSSLPLRPSFALCRVTLASANATAVISIGHKRSWSDNKKHSKIWIGPRKGSLRHSFSQYTFVDGYYCQRSRNEICSTWRRVGTHVKCSISFDFHKWILDKFLCFSFSPSL